MMKIDKFLTYFICLFYWPYMYEFIGIISCKQPDSEVEIHIWFPNGDFSVEYIRVFLFVLRTSDNIHRPCFSSSRIAVSKVFFVSDLLKKLTSVRASFKLSDALYIIDWCNAMSDQNSFRLWTLKKNSTGFDIDSLNIMQQNWQNVEFLDTKKFALIFGITRTRYSQDLTLIR